MQRQVYAEVQRTRDRSGWSVRRTLLRLGVPPSSYYRWLREEAWAKALPAKPPPRLLPYEALAEEKEAVRQYALKHPGIRHRELAWRMVDEGVAYLSPSTVYRILKEHSLVCPWRRRRKRFKEETEKPSRRNEVWATDLKYVAVGERNYYLITFIDEYSRYIVHHELLASMDGHTVSVAAQAAVETLALDDAGKLVDRPTIRALEGEELTNYLQAQAAIGKIMDWYNEERLHSALGFLRPADYYRGAPEVLYEERRRKLAHARHRRREENLRLRQRTLPLESAEVVA